MRTYSFLLGSVVGTTVAPARVRPGPGARSCRVRGGEPTKQFARA